MTSARDRLAVKATPGPMSTIRRDTGETVTVEASIGVPPRVRTVAYFTMLISSALGSLIIGLVAIWWPDLAPQVGATVAAILSAEGIVAGGLGVAYRPTAGGNG